MNVSNGGLSFASLGIWGKNGRMNKISRLLAVGALTGAIGACAFNVEPFLSKEITGTDFSSYLAREYQRRTETEVNVDVQWVHASRLASKGESALAGAQVLPWMAADWNVAEGDRADLESARATLMQRLERGREATPEACARAQVYYDGWLEQSHDNDWGETAIGPVQPDYVAAERAAFEDILSLCGGGYVVYFGFDRTDLTDAALAVIEEIVAIASGQNISIVGHTDTSGPAAYNDGLSERRAQSVAQALRQRGASVSNAGGEGESDLAVPTADEVREPLNRRATVFVN